jgi:hypothetical protein
MLVAHPQSTVQVRIIVCAVGCVAMGHHVYIQLCVHVTKELHGATEVAVLVLAVASLVCDEDHSNFDTRSIQMNECKYTTQMTFQCALVTICMWYVCV